MRLEELPLTISSRNPMLRKEHNFPPENASSSSTICVLVRPNMKIQSIDGVCSIQIGRGPESDCGVFVVEVKVDLGHGEFIGSNRSFCFVQLSQFINDFERFIIDGHSESRLEGTYDSFFAFHREGTAVFLEFSVGDGFCGYSSYCPFAVSGRFEVGGDQLAQTVSDFKELRDSAKDVWL